MAGMRTSAKTTMETIRKTNNIVRNALEEQYGDEFKFDPIITIPRLDHEDDEYLHVYVVYEGDRENLDPGWISDLLVIILDGLTEDEVFRVPATSFVPKASWEEGFKRQYRWGDDLIVKGAEDDTAWQQTLA